MVAASVSSSVDPEARPVILYLLRHGKADPYGSMPDDARQLTDDGRTALRAAAPYWTALGVKPDVVLTSPRQRAVDTATLFMAGVGLPGAPVAVDDLAPGAEWTAMARAIAPYTATGSVMLVGHEPDLSRSVKHLTGAASVRLREGGLCRLEFHGSPEAGSGEITLLLDPDLYVAGPMDPK